MLVDEARKCFEPKLQETVASTAERMYDVLPETVAPIVSMSLDPRMSSGFYLMLDMGAGTSEFSVNLVNGHGVHQKIVCYFDKTRRIGGDDLEAAERKPTNQREDELSQLVERVVKWARTTCFRGFEKDMRNRCMSTKWKEVKLLLTGGAVRRSEIESHLRRLLPLDPHVPGESRYSVSWHEPILGTRSLGLKPTELSLLAVSHGLSLHRQQWPVVFSPECVEQFTGDEVIERPVGYWYVDN